jgi:uncharacterized membrane protein HdeD (DUF308 family)
MRKSTISDFARDWWVMGLRGLAAVAAGIIMLATSFPRIDNVLRVFGGYLLIDGAILLIIAALAARQHKSWTKKEAVNGLLGIVFGVVNLIGGSPVLMRADFIALRTFIAGVSGIVSARQLRVDPPETPLVWLLMLAGVSSAIFSILLAGGLLLEERIRDQFGWLAAAYLFAFGLLFLAISAWLLVLHRRPASALPA